MPRRILHVVSNVARYGDSAEPTGLWLSELTHAWQVFAAKGYEQRIVSPKGGASPLEPRSLQWPNLDATARRGWPMRRAWRCWRTRPGPTPSTRPTSTRSTSPAGTPSCGTSLDAQELQRITRAIYERGGVVSSVCHGYCGLLNTTLSDGALLVAGRRLTGFSWREEVLAGVARKVPYNAEQEMQRRRALRESAAALRLQGGGRWATGDRPEPAVGQGDGRAVAAPLG
jgi:putative intracellular protease/amidase